MPSFNQGRPWGQQRERGSAHSRPCALPTSEALTRIRFGPGRAQRCARLVDLLRRDVS